MTTARTSTACVSTFSKTRVSLNGLGGTTGGSGCGAEASSSLIGLGAKLSGACTVIDVVYFLLE